MSAINKVSFHPPSQKYFPDSLDEEELLKSKLERESYVRFQELNLVDIIRTSGLVHHPSRETNSIVEGELLRNHQDKIFQSMRVIMAEYCVKNGIWKDLDEAFHHGDMIKRNRFRQMLRN